MSEADQLRLQTAASTTIGGIESSLLQPIQKKSFLCSAACFDSVESPESLQNCVQTCQQPPTFANQVVQQEVSEFQQRIQRAMQGCQDKASDVMRNGGKEAAARAEMEKCGRGVIEEQIGNLKGLDKRIKATLKANKII